MWNIFHFIYHTEKPSLNFLIHPSSNHLHNWKWQANWDFNWQDTWAEAQTPGFSSVILKQKKCPLEQKGPQTFPSKEANTGPKHCKQSIKCLWRPRMLRKNLSPWLLEAVRMHQGKVYPVSVCLLQTLSMHWSLSADMGCWIGQALFKPNISTFTLLCQQKWSYCKGKPSSKIKIIYLFLWTQLPFPFSVFACKSAWRNSILKKKIVMA